MSLVYFLGTTKPLALPSTVLPVYVFAGILLILQAVAGIIGIPTANLLFESISASGKITAEMVLSDFNKHHQGLDRMMPHHITALNEEIYRCLELGKQGEF